MRGLRLGNIRIYQLLIVLISVSVIFVLTTQYTVYQMFYTSMSDTSLEYLDSSIVMMKKQIETQLSYVSSIVQKTAYNENIIYFISASPSKKIDMIKIVRPLFKTMQDSSPIVRNIHMRMKNNRYLTSEPFSGYDQLPGMINRMVKDYDVSQPFDRSFFTKAYTGETHDSALLAYWVPMYRSATVQSTDSRYYGAWIAILDVDVMVNAVLAWEEGGDMNPVVALYEDGQLIYSTNGDPEVLGALSHPNGITSGYQVRKEIVEPIGWELLYAISDDQFMSDISAIRTQTYSMMGIVAAIQICIGFALFRSIARPLSEITAHLSSIDLEHNKKELSVQTKNEIGVIAQEINQMLNRITDFNTRVISMQEEIHRSEMAHMRAHILYLQMQINPHFLYNNLECIRGMVGQNASDAVCEMVTSMAFFYRYCASAQLVVTLGQELNALRDFLTIIRLRYGDKYCVHIAVDPLLMERPCAKMTLQPLLENCILHGYKASASNGEIWIRGFMADDGATILTISDDGEGMPDAEMERFNNRANDDADGGLLHVGMRNVDMRLRLTFGEGCGLSLSAREPRGLIVTVRMASGVMESTA